MRFGNLNHKKLTLMLLLLAVAVVLIVMYTRNTSNKPVGLTGPSLQVLPVGLTGPSLQVLPVGLSGLSLPLSPVGLTGPSLQVSPVVAAPVVAAPVVAAPVVTAPVVAAPVSGPVAATNFYSAGFCNSGTVTFSDPGVLKSSPSEPDATSFTDPRYLGWVDKAATIEKTRGNGAKYISVWLDGGYRAHATCTSIINPLQRGGKLDSAIYVIL